MPIEVGAPFPEATLWESAEFGAACPVSPAPVSTTAALKGKRVVVFGLPGAYTNTCSEKHVPGYLANYDALKQKGVDEVWCVSVNDGQVMAAWGRDQKAIPKIRFLGDGSADLAKKLGLERDLIADGMGIRMRRCSMLVENGVIKSLNLEEKGKFGQTAADTMLQQIGG